MRAGRKSFYKRRAFNRKFGPSIMRSLRRGEFGVITGVPIIFSAYIGWKRGRRPARHSLRRRFRKEAA